MRRPEENFKISIAAGISCILSKIFDLTCYRRIKNHKPESEPAIYAIYHGWQYILGGMPDRKKLHILISQSNDGEIITRVVHFLGFSTIRGSMGRGGSKATREILKALNEGKNIAYTVDGPRGPGFKVKEGIIRIAQMSGRPIIPYYGDAFLRLEINSWDKYQIPIPFSPIGIELGEPMYVPQGDEYVEEYRLKLENALLDLQKQYREVN